MSESRALVVLDRGIGPLDRFAVTVADPNTMEVVGQRVMDGETLKQVARSWGVPVMRFVEWVTGEPERDAVYEAALRVRADELAMETVGIADDGDEVPRDSLRVSTRMKLAAFLDRERFGERQAVRRTARVIVDRAGAAADTPADRVASDRIAVEFTEE